MDRVFLNTQFALHYRRARRVRFNSEALSDYALLVVLRGALKLQKDESVLKLTNGNILLLDPGASFNASGQEAECLSLAVSSSYMLDCAVRTRMVSEGNSIAFRTSKIESDKRLLSVMRDLARELEDEEAGQQIIIAALVEQILVHLLRRYTNVRRSQELELSRVGLIDRRIRRAVELMHARLDQDLALEEIAGAAHLSPYHFSRLFKKLTGATPHAYLASLRTAQAQILLADTDLSITQVSARVGYASPSHFTKSFRQTTGLTPRAFRAALINR